MTSDVQQGPLEPAPALPPPQATKKTWREQRWERRRRRMWFEEVLGLFLVPIILFSVYWVVDGFLGALGTSPSAIIAGVNAILAGH
jgi:hypothetical protein